MKRAKRRAVKIMRHIWGMGKRPRLDPKTGIVYYWGKMVNGRYHPIPVEDTIQPDLVGKEAAVHCRGCSCFVCQNHNPKKKMMVEDLKFKEQVNDLFYSNDPDLLEDGSEP
jgi:hypothetical protein